MGHILVGSVGRLVTRGNLDGIACAAVFLDRFPGAAVSFVTSPPAALREVASEATPTIVADLPLTAEMGAALASRRGQLLLVDHHPTALRSEHATVDPDKSAAGALRACLGNGERTARVASLADVHEMADSPLVGEMVATHGRERLEAEASVLDLAWRFNVEDDDFRLRAARSLAEGRWPSEVPLIEERWRAVRDGGRWGMAVGAVADDMEVRGGVGLLDLRGRRRSLQGFGSVALAEVARTRGCRYTLLLHSSKGTATASLRSTARDGMDLGLFVEEFTSVHGIGGGGHRSAAGARVPTGAADLLIDQMVAAAC